jgi:hypothetical protein
MAESDPEQTFTAITEFGVGRPACADSLRS